MTNAQLVAIVDKFLKDNPDKWHLPAAELVWLAFLDLVC
jgi:hypothetical protein